MNNQSVLRTYGTDNIYVVDPDALLLAHDVKKHTFIANSKEEFFITYVTLLSVFQQISGPEIRVYAFILQHYSTSPMFVVNGSLRKMIMAATNLSAGTVNNTLMLLSKGTDMHHPLLYRISKGTYQMNPRYAFKGSTHNRNKSLKTIIELGCVDC